MHSRRNSADAKAEKAESALPGVLCSPVVTVKTDPVRIIWRESGQAGTALDWSASGIEAGTQP